MKRQYELMVLVRADVNTDDEKKGKELVATFAGDGVAIKELSSLGKKRLAYPIKKQQEAIYLVSTLEAGHLSVAELEKRAKLNEKILRFLLIAKQ